MNVKEKIVLLLLAALNFTHILDCMIMMPLGKYLTPYFDVSSQQFFSLVAAYTFSSGILGFLAAFFVDNFICFLLLSRVVPGTFGGAQVLSIVTGQVCRVRSPSKVKIQFSIKFWCKSLIKG